MPAIAIPAATAMGKSLFFTGAGAGTGAAAATLGAGAFSGLGLGPRPGIGVDTMVSSLALSLRAVARYRAGGQPGNCHER